MRTSTEKLINYIMLSFFAILVLAPFLWIATIAFKTQIDIMMMKIIFKPTLFNFDKLFFSKEATFFRDIFNSLFVGIISTLIILIVCSMASFTMIRTKISNWITAVLFLWVIVFHMLPPITFVGSWFQMANSVGLFNSRIALILAHVTVNLPLGLLIISSFMRDVPTEIQEAAYIDGCSNRQVYLKVMLPLLGPGLFATAVIVFLFSWNDFMVAMNLTAKATQTVPVSIATFSQQYEVRYGEMAAGSLVSLVPALILTFFAQKYIVKGLTAGAVK
jgi:multiple sugar transport system permease protein|tara:strand:+ start:22 stop:846 length:825 start_codon:yes stop_codon:yes gene_type:complete